MFYLTYGIQTRKKTLRKETTCEYRENSQISSGDMSGKWQGRLEHRMFKVPGIHA